MKSVLLVDDDENFVETLKAGLTNVSGDFLVLTATNGRKAVQILESTTVDLMVTDLKEVFPDAHTISGAAQLGGGQLALVLNVPEILKSLGQQGTQSQKTCDGDVRST